jgi:hypothetical protein
MIDQFFKDVEGPDRDWYDEDYDMLMNQDRPVLLSD